jgi:hypothetical protein
MMQTLILTFVVFLAAVLAMVVGVLVTGRSLKGSCGGPSCKCVADGADVTRCGGEDEIRSEGSLPLYSGR